MLNKKNISIALPFALSASLIGSISFSEWNYETEAVNQPQSYEPQKSTHLINQIHQNTLSTIDGKIPDRKEISSKEKINKLLDQNRTLRDRLFMMPEFQQYFRWKYSETHSSYILGRIWDIQDIEVIFQKDPAFFKYFEWLTDYQKYLDGDSVVDIFRIQAIQKVYQAMIQYPPEVYTYSVSQPWWNDLHPAEQLRKIHSNQMYIDILKKYPDLNWVLKKYNLTILTIESEDPSGSRYEWIITELTDEMIDSHTEADEFQGIVDIYRRLQDDPQLPYILDQSLLQSFYKGELSCKDLWKLSELISKIHISQE